MSTFGMYQNHKACPGLSIQELIPHLRMPGGHIYSSEKVQSNQIPKMSMNSVLHVLLYLGPILIDQSISDSMHPVQPTKYVGTKHAAFPIMPRKDFKSCNAHDAMSKIMLERCKTCPSGTR